MRSSRERFQRFVSLSSILFVCVFLIGGLPSSARIGALECILRVPPGTSAGGVFQAGRAPELEYQLLSMVTFIPGDHALPTLQGEHEYELFEKYEFGPQREPGVPRGAGTLSLSISQVGDITYYNYTFRKTFLVGTKEVPLRFENLNFRSDGSIGSDQPLVIEMDEEYLSIRLFLFGQINMGGPWPESLRYKSPRYGVLPLWGIEGRTSAGDRVELRERFSIPMVGAGPANLTEGRVEILEGERTVTDYWHLVYAAQNHNWDPYYWVVLDPPLDQVFIVELHIQTYESEPDHVWMLNRQFEPVRQPELLEIQKWPINGVGLWEVY